MIGARAAEGSRSEIVDERQVHVWFVSLEQTDDRVAELADTLSGEERSRAARFHFPRDRRHYIVARGFLRTILGRYVDTTPRGVEFRYGLHGKPALDGRGRESGLRFNLSHANGRALYGLTRDREIGVDLEFVRPLPDVEAMVRRFFSARERAAFQRLPLSERLPAFFRCWTRKESYVKAIGDGLQCPLDRFDVSLEPGAPARLQWVDGDPEGPRRWTLYSLEPEGGFVAAVAVEGRGVRFRRRR